MLVAWARVVSVEVLGVTCTVGGRGDRQGWGMGLEGRSQAVDCSLNIKMNYGGIYWEEEAEADL